MYGTEEDDSVIGDMLLLVADRDILGLQNITSVIRMYYSMRACFTLTNGDSFERMIFWWRARLSKTINFWEVKCM